MDFAQNATVDYYNANAKKWTDDHNDLGWWGDYFGKFADLAPVGHLLEVGCGGGRDARHLIAMGYQYTGFDASLEVLQIAKQNNPTGTFFCSTVEELSLATKFDSWWAAASLLHLPQTHIGQSLRNIHKVLKGGAVGLIALKKHIDGLPAERIEQDRFGKRFFRYWTSANFEWHLNSAGFQLVQPVEEFPTGNTTWLMFFARK